MKNSVIALQLIIPLIQCSITTMDTTTPTSSPTIKPIPIIQTVAGTGTAGSSGDGDMATSAFLNHPNDVTLDISGNLYIADSYNHRIRMVSVETGQMSTVVGAGSPGFHMDGVPASRAMLNYPYEVVVDTSGNIFISDTVNNRIRKVDKLTNKISTVAGTGKEGYSGDGHKAVKAEIYYPHGIALDEMNNLYFADYGNNRIRMVKAVNQTMYTVAGTGNYGYSGDGGPATNAKLYNPIGVFVDFYGHIFIADVYNQRIRKIDGSSGIITTIVGTGAKGFGGDGGPATLAMLNVPSAVVVDSSSGDIYISDTDNRRIRVVSNGTISTYVGSSSKSNKFNIDNGAPATSAILLAPTGLALDTLGNLYFTEMFSSTVRAALTLTPTTSPTFAPSNIGDTNKPSIAPSRKPSKGPSREPTAEPTAPSRKPSRMPTLSPSTLSPSRSPTAIPSLCPTISPSKEPTFEPSSR